MVEKHLVENAQLVLQVLEQVNERLDTLESRMEAFNRGMIEFLEGPDRFNQYFRTKADAKFWWFINKLSVGEEADFDEFERTAEEGYKTSTEGGLEL